MMGKRRWVLAAALLGLLAAMAGCRQFSSMSDNSPAAVPSFATPYQAVLLDDNQVYYGKLEDLGDRYVTLRDVYYIRRELNPKTKQVSNVLVERGKEEWHQPDHMVINAEHIVLIEPVGIHSQVARLIAESRQGKTAAIPTPTP